MSYKKQQSKRIRNQIKKMKSFSYIRKLNENIRESEESFIPFNCGHCGQIFNEKIDTEGHRCLLIRNDLERT